MQIVHSFEEISSSSRPVVLTVGNFDGMHLGHQALLKRLQEISQQQKAQSAVLTFSNHPSKVLRPTHPTPLMCTVEHKLLLLELAAINQTIILPFTKEFSEQSPEIFLKKIKYYLPFQTLLLGSDAHMGKNREGDQKTVNALGKTLGFDVEYFQDIEKDGKRISSSLIRDCIRQGDLKQAEILLGRPYSIYNEVVPGLQKGTSLGFPTANLNVEDLCLPPLGVYAVRLCIDNKKYDGVANLGIAPTVRQNNKPVLEVHLFDQQHNLYGKKVNVQFLGFIREEKQFANIDELKAQIARDVTKAKQLIN